MKQNLSKLKQVNLRNVWPHEALDFTNWLAEKENLDLLSQEIGVSLKLIQTEANVGKFNVDILAEDELTSRKVIIENQLEDTNHDHLGKIITYAAGYDAQIVLWIVRNVREEHQRALEWLNEHSDQNIGFFLIKLELWQIENSNPAPKFDIIVSPNEWAKLVRNSVTNTSASETQMLQLTFWQSFKNYVSNIDKSLRLQTPRPQHWFEVSIGSSLAHIALTINSKDNSISCEFQIPNEKTLYNFLKERKLEIEQELGIEASWYEARKYSGLRVKRSVENLFDETKQEEYFKWLYNKTIIFQRIFSKYLKEYKSQN